MTKIKRKLVTLLALVLAASIIATGCNLVQKKPEAIAKQRVAKVGDEYITRAELDEMFAYLKERIKAQTGYDDNFFTSEQGKELLTSQKKLLLDNMVEQKLLEQKARELNLFKDESAIKDEIKKVIDEQVKAGKSEDEYKKWLEEAKLTPELLDKLVRQQVIAEKVYENTTKDTTVADDEVQKYYNENMSTFTEKPNTMEVSHILLNTEEEAKDIRSKLDKGEDFAALAKQYSTEPAAKESGGSLGEMQYNDPNYDPTFVAAAMALKEGEISQPVQTSFGYHIIKVTKKTEYPVLPFDKVKEEIKSQLAEQKKLSVYDEALKGWKEKTEIKTYDKNIDN